MAAADAQVLALIRKNMNNSVGGCCGSGYSGGALMSGGRFLGGAKGKLSGDELKQRFESGHTVKFGKASKAMTGDEYKAYYNKRFGAAAVADRKAKAEQTRAVNKEAINAAIAREEAKRPISSKTGEPVALTKLEKCVIACEQRALTRYFKGVARRTMPEGERELFLAQPETMAARAELDPYHLRRGGPGGGGQKRTPAQKQAYKAAKASMSEADKAALARVKAEEKRILDAVKAQAGIPVGKKK